MNFDIYKLLAMNKFIIKYYLLINTINILIRKQIAQIKLWYYYDIRIPILKHKRCRRTVPWKTPKIQARIICWFVIIFIFMFYFSIDMLTRSYSDRSNDRNRDVSSNRERDYDSLKQQYDKAMHELMMLRRYTIFILI